MTESIELNNMLSESGSKQEQVTLLKEKGVKAWNEWKSQRAKELEKEKGRSVENQWCKPQEKKKEEEGSFPNFMSFERPENPFNLSQADFAGLDLTGVDLSGTALEGTRFNKATLKNANLSYANLADAHLDDANLSGATLNSAYIFRATIYRANLSQAICQGTDFTAANLTDANLTNCDLSTCDMNNAKLNGAKLSNTKMPVAPGEIRKEELKDLPAGTAISIVYRPGLTPVHLFGNYLGVQGNKMTMQVYRTVNYGKQIGFDDAGRKRLEDYTPDERSTYNIQDFSLNTIEGIYRQDS